MIQEDSRIQLAAEMAKNGCISAMLEVVKYYISHDDKNALVENIELILCYLTKLAEENDGFAMRHLGNLYNGGRGVVQDHKKAIEWYEKASIALDTYAMCSLGYIYYYGRGDKQDYLKAYKYFSEAAFMKNVNAMYKLGDMYYYGKHVSENKDKAFFWYREAENQPCLDYEESSIQYRLGLCYLHGHGVDKDLLEAYEYLSSAEKGLIEQIQDGDTYGIARLILPQVSEVFETARKLLYSTL